MTKNDRLVIIFVVPLLLTVLTFGFFAKIIPIVKPNASSEEIAAIKGELRGDTRALNDFLLALLSLQFPQVLTYGVCLENRNELSLLLFDSYVNIDDININGSNFFDTSGAMEFQFWLDDNDYISLYAQRGNHDCDRVKISQMKEVRVEGYFNELLTAPTNTGGIYATTSDSVMDTDKSRLYLFLPDYYFPFIYVLTWIAWSGLVLLFSGISKFIREGF